MKDMSKYVEILATLDKIAERATFTADKTRNCQEYTPDISINELQKLVDSLFINSSVLRCKKHNHGTALGCNTDRSPLNEVDDPIENVFKAVIELAKYQFDAKQVAALSRLANKFKALTDDLVARTERLQAFQWDIGKAKDDKDIIC